TVAGSGIVEAQTENIAVGSPLSGVVTRVFVKVGDPVTVGAPLFQLDDRALKAEEKYRAAALAAAEAQLKRLENQPRQEERLPSRAKAEEAEANFPDKKDLTLRARALSARRAIEEETKQRREQAFRAAEASLRRARAEHALLEAGAWQWDKEVAAAAVTQARA